MTQKRCGTIRKKKRYGTGKFDFEESESSGVILVSYVKGEYLTAILYAGQG
jgi:hypothetical protein